MLMGIYRLDVLFIYSEVDRIMQSCFFIIIFLIFWKSIEPSISSIPYPYNPKPAMLLTNKITDNDFNIPYVPDLGRYRYKSFYN